MKRYTRIKDGAVEHVSVIRTRDGVLHDANAENPTTPASYEITDVNETINVDELDINGFATLNGKQLRTALYQEWGVTLADVKAIIAAMPDSDAKEMALIELEESTGYHRHHPLITSVAQVLNKASDEVDRVWLKYQGT